MDWLLHWKNHACIKLLIHSVPCLVLCLVPASWTQNSPCQAPEGENQPSTEVDLFISTEKIMVLNTDLKEIMMDHSLRTISNIADIGELVVIMARRRVLPQVRDEEDPDTSS